MTAQEGTNEVRLTDSITFDGGLLPAAWPSDRFAKLLLKKQDDLLSRTCLDPSPTSVTSPSGSLGAHHDPAQVEECVQRHMASLAGELQKILQHVTDELATEVNREQQHLILMQDQVDKLSTMLLRELLDISKKAEQEKTQRSCVHRATREALDQLAARVDSQSRQLEQQTCQLDTLQRRLADLEAPLIVRIFRGIWRMFFGRGSGAKTSAAAAADKKGSGAKSGMAKLGTPEEGTLAEERAAFMTPGQRRASREADAE